MGSPTLIPILLVIMMCTIGYGLRSSNHSEPLIPVRLRNFSMKEDNKTAIFEWSNNQTEVAELQQEDDECIYRGTFKEDDGSRVLVTGCLGEHRSIQIQSFLHGDTLGTSINGSVELLRGHGDLLTNDTVENNEFIHQFDTEHPEKRVKREYVRNDDFLTDFPASKNANRKIIFPKLLELPIRIYLAPSWRSKFYGGRSKATEVLSHVKELYLHYSLETKFDITYKKSDIFDTSAELSPSSDNLETLAEFVSAPSSGHAAIVYLTTTTAGDTLGIAAVAAICSRDRKTSRSISKWAYSDIYTAQTVAHEIGHNLGFFHDFDTDTYDGGRTRACGPGQWNNGPDNDLMNYTPGTELTQNKWSDCTKEDFRNYFSRVTSSEGSTFCLRDGSDIQCSSVCEDSDLNLICPDNDLVSVTSAMYGRQETETCPSFFAWKIKTPATDCKSNRSVSTVEDLCRGQNSCSVEASNDVFGGDPCKGTSKYIKVCYKCIPSGMSIFVGDGACRGMGWSSKPNFPKFVGYLTKSECEDTCANDVGCTAFDIDDQQKGYKWECHHFGHQDITADTNISGSCYKMTK